MIKKYIVLIICAVYLSTVLTACRGKNVVVSDSRTEDTGVDYIVHGEAMWQSLTFEQAIDEADCIIYGKVVKKGGVKSRDYHPGEKQKYEELGASYPPFFFYREVEIQLILIEKENYSEPFIYNEFGGIYERVEYQYGIPAVSEGESVVLFLKRWKSAGVDHALVSPAYLYTVDENEMIRVKSSVISGEEEDGQTVLIPVSEYFEMIKSYINKKDM